MYYVNENIRDTERIFPDEGRAGFLRLDMNENPEGLPEDVVAKIREAITPEFLSRYPEPSRFIEKYAAFVGVKPSQICATNGSDNAIRYLLQTFAHPGGEVVTVEPTFEMYKVNCWLLGLKHVSVPYKDDYQVDSESLINSITDQTNIVALVNPNNPIGDVYDEKAARAIIEAAHAHDAIVIIDEAYHYFTDKTLLPLVNEYDNVVVLRTFSKCFSLAGVRLGVIVSNPELTHIVNNLRLSFEVNTFALLCGETVLDTPGLIEKLATIQREGRSWVSGQLEDCGYAVLPSEANFISFQPRHDAAVVAERLADEGVLVKTFGSGPLAGWIRLNTGSVDIMKRFMDALKKADA